MNNKKNRITEIYNKKDLYISPENTIIIIDWDDTLYPTSWVIGNNIDLTDPIQRYKYIKHFEKLDDLVSTALEHMITLGEVIIITNAMVEWIQLSVSVLPKTMKCISKIEIISARQRQQNKTQMTNWKKHTFLEEITKRAKKKRYHNILSLGDADFEHAALVNLYNNALIPHKYLKSIKFIKSSDYDITTEQLKMIKKYIASICKMTRQVDMTFDTN